MLSKDDLKVTEKVTPREFSDLPTITCEIGIGREKKTTVNFFYRECTSGLSGLSDIGAQSERLKRQIQCWTNLQNPNSDIVSQRICVRIAPNGKEWDYWDSERSHKEVGKGVLYLLLIWGRCPHTIAPTCMISSMLL